MSNISTNNRAIHEWKQLRHFTQMTEQKYFVAEDEQQCSLNIIVVTLELIDHPNLPVNYTHTGSRKNLSCEGRATITLFSDKLDLFTAKCS